MRNKWKGMLFACMLALPSFLPFTVSQPAYAAEAPQKLADDVKVQVNDELVHFPDAQPFVDENHKLLVPARVVADKLGLQVQWEQTGSNIKVTLKDKDNKKALTMTTGQSEVNVNGSVSNNTYEAAALVDGRVYTPFRLIADSFGIQTQWDGSNRIAILGADGKYHAPAWYRQVVKAPVYKQVLNAKATAYTAAPSENGGYGSLDYMGNQLKLGTIAVDPSVIPLGSKVYIEGYSYDGLPSGGMYATATDIGGAINGSHVDIFLPESPAKASNFGVQQVKVYVLGS
ncbi:stalk domain-containing protein [Paenibacillus filicis]|uniref:Stalk domain-containing protein n=1 Tax=Paenibacillus gyeongsangnamensis TaxID=3388067 RepID=A0ABT4QHH9_9BACL|nr:stalk domain-containing protein [Paenibacillus filicis]MCZ8516160.1 stalk domain-containing protein [Paenibacillus filicis]